MGCQGLVSVWVVTGWYLGGDWVIGYGRETVCLFGTRFWEPSPAVHARVLRLAQLSSTRLHRLLVRLHPALRLGVLSLERVPGFGFPLVHAFEIAEVPGAVNKTRRRQTNCPYSQSLE